MELGNKGDQASWARYTTTGGSSGPGGGARTWVASTWSSLRLGPRSLMALVIAAMVSCVGLKLLMRANGQYAAAVKQARYPPERDERTLLNSTWDAARAMGWQQLPTSCQTVGCIKPFRGMEAATRFDSLRQRLSTC